VSTRHAAERREALLEAERGLLGAALLERDLPAGAAELQPGDFREPAHRPIWAAILRLRERGDASTPELVAVELGADLPTVGGAVGLDKITSGAALPRAVAGHVRAIRRAARARARAAELDLERRSLVEGPLPDLPADRTPALVTAADLMRRTYPVPRWCVPGILPEGLVLLAGKPKIGKSWLALAAARAVAQGGEVLGSRTEPGQVLYLALEDSLRRIQHRLGDLDRDDSGQPSDLLIATTWPALDAASGGLAALDAWLTEHPACRLVVADTLARLRPRTARSNGSAYQADVLELAPVQRLALDHRICLLGLAHMRKAAADDPLDEINGSSGLSGTADCVLLLRRGRGDADGELRVIGRDLEERHLALRFEGGAWTLLGDAAEVVVSAERRAVLEALRSEGRPMRPGELAEVLGRPRVNLVQLLLRMADAGQVAHGLGGTYRISPERERSSITEITDHHDHQDHQDHQPAVIAVIGDPWIST